jgi:hypothetical protein
MTDCQLPIGAMESPPHMAGEQAAAVVALVGRPTE